MRKTRIYLDTSVISHLEQNDVPDKMNDTLRLWEQIKQGQYEVYISNVTLDEIGRCYEPKQTVLTEYLAQIDYNLITINKEIDDVAQKFIDNNILTIKSLDDCRHIACSIVCECDIIISWNFKHIVNYRTIKGVKLVSLMTGYDEVAIYSPTVLVEGEDSNVGIEN